jgi:predicted TPR repeat methyltransferase
LSKSLSPEYFSKLYAENPDPWNFATSDYEASKYRRTIKSLPRLTYRQAFEIGCSIGVLTASLASRCEHLLSVDVSEEALRQARERCASLANVEFERMSVPGEYPSGSFDLTVVSEVGYYLGWEDLEKLALRIQKHTVAQGQLLLVHWLPFVNDYPLTGDQVHEYFLSLPDWQCLSGFRTDRYRIELLELRG